MALVALFPTFYPSFYFYFGKNHLGSERSYLALDTDGDNHLPRQSQV